MGYNVYTLKHVADLSVVMNISTNSSKSMFPNGIIDFMFADN